MKARAAAGGRRVLGGWLFPLAAAAALVALGAGTLGCETEAACVDCIPCSTSSECPGGQCVNGFCQQGVGGSGGGGAATSTGTGGECIFDCGGGGTGGGTGGGGPCQPTNGGVEICDGLDNDCNGETDDGFDMNAPEHCGTCANNCFAIMVNTNPATVTCDWSGQEGQEGTCDFTECASDYYDLTPNQPGCEYYCVQEPPGNTTDDSVCNNKDDDCDGTPDEDVDLCTSTTDCGSCGVNCSVVHGTGECVNTGGPPCSPVNTQCQIQVCDDDDNDGLPDWHDEDNSYATGCEYPCEITDGGAGLGVEACGDAIDNDCDGEIDAADSDLSGDPNIGADCWGDDDGLCADPAHWGVYECQGSSLVCVGANVLVENQEPEVCNNVDDDCDGVVDDSPTDVGQSCGISSIFPCTLGTTQCNNGNPECVGNIDPGVETCNAIDDDCDGDIDLANGNPPADSVGACNEPPPPPGGITTPCQAGSLTCTGGVVVCENSIGPGSQTTDLCGEDSNCDGSYTWGGDTSSDINNCGSCGNQCYDDPLKAHTVITCDTGVCTFHGCDPNWYDYDDDEICTDSCFPSGAEVCDGVDNDCNGDIDDGLATPDPTQVCGVSPNALSSECIAPQVTVACAGGNWTCTFATPGVCDPDCASTAEICDGYDNNCDGNLNENVPNFGDPCFSDEGMPPPGHGACRTQGNYICNGTDDTVCDATPSSCAPNCAELCDGIDNDCDGLVDEDYTVMSGDQTYFVQPDVVQIDTNLWMFAHEASRPDADSVSAGSGNGYHCGSACAPLPDAPSGVPLNETIACSVQGSIPWFNVNAIEVEQTCDAIGGRVCDDTEWMQACQAQNSCVWGYNPNSIPACRSTWTASKYCNIGPFDFDLVTGGNQDGLLPTGTTCGSQPCLQNCWADWGGLLNNPANAGIFDITGNLREIAFVGGSTYVVLGGAFNSPEGGASCTFDFYKVPDRFKLFDTGFRCCFDSDPRVHL